MVVDAVQRYPGLRYAMVISDIEMPDMDGFETTRRIREELGLPATQLPIVALTANTNPVERQRCIDAGMDDVLDKPMDLQTLVRSVSRHVLKARV